MIYVNAQKTLDLIANTLKNLEELAYQGDKAVVLPNFPRCLQLDGWNCGSRSLYCILVYFGKRCTINSVERELRTDWEGTDVADIKRVLSKHGLKYREKNRCSVSDLTKAVDDGLPVLITTHSSWHYEVVYGYSMNHLYVANSAILGECGSVWCRVPRREFLKIWDHWGIIVSDT